MPSEFFCNNKDYQILVQSVTDYVVAINKSYQVVMANSLFKQNFNMYKNGYCYKLWLNRDERCEKCLVKESFFDGKVHFSEKKVVMKNGKTAFMMIKSTPVKNEHGNIVYILETATDLTEKKRLEEKLQKIDSLYSTIAKRSKELQKSEEKYRTIFEHSEDVIIITDPAGKILEVNSAGVYILGYKSSDALLSLQSVSELFVNSEALTMFQKTVYREGYFKEFETKVVCNNKRIIDVLATTSVIIDTSGTISGYIVIIKDISSQKQAQRKVEKQNTRLSVLNSISMQVCNSLNLNDVLNSTIDRILAILESDSVRIYLIDKTKNMLYLAAHKGLSSYFISQKEMKSRKIGDGILGQVIVNGKTRVVEDFLQYNDPYIELFIYEGLKSTVYIPLISRGEPVGEICVSSHTEFKLSDGYVKFLMGIGNQIGVAIDNAILYEHTTKANQKLQDVQEQVVRTEKLASLGKLAATIAHEINNPLAAVLNYTKLVKKIIKRSGSIKYRIEDIFRYLDVMAQETARCGEIVKNLLAFSRQTQTEFHKHKVDDIIEKTSILINHDLKIKNIKLKVIIESDLPAIQCNFKQLQQAFLNLMGNAAESMKNGGILTVAVRRSVTKKSIDIVFADTGCGISEENMEDIFEPFFTTKEEGKGVGLGLSVVYGIIIKHNGAISVESKPGKGSTFTVRLPVYNDQVL